VLAQELLEEVRGPGVACDRNDVQIRSGH
jgi:hypothetical protein